MLQSFVRGFCVQFAVFTSLPRSLCTKASMARVTRRAVATRSYKISDSENDSPLSSPVSDYEPPASPEHSSGPPSLDVAMDLLDPEVDSDIPAGEEELKEAVSRPPAVNSSYLPLPWKGRLGYVCTIWSSWEKAKY